MLAANRAQTRAVPDLKRGDIRTCGARPALHIHRQLSFSWPRSQGAYYPHLMGVGAKGKNPSSHLPRPAWDHQAVGGQGGPHSQVGEKYAGAGSAPGLLPERSPSWTECLHSHKIHRHTLCGSTQQLMPLLHMGTAVGAWWGGVTHQETPWEPSSTPPSPPSFPHSPSL